VKLLATAAVVAATALVAVLVLRGSDDAERPAARGAATPSSTPTAAPSPEPPDPDARLPRGAEALAGDLADTRAALWDAIDHWRRDGDPAHGGAPDDVALLALHQQRIYRLLARSPELSRGVIAALPRSLRAEAHDDVLARRELVRIVSVHRGPPPRISVGAPEPADELRAHYRRAFARFRVAPQLLAAVNFVESAFGKLRNRSVSGARGPMQFIPATWRAYGLGGDIEDPRDAILGAANYLHANGAPRSELGALLHYNPSRDYASAITRYARRIRADWRAFYAYYAWSVYVDGKRLSGPRTLSARGQVRSGQASLSRATRRRAAAPRRRARASRPAAGHRG
jgi:soluble lytic murein transglycosylase-like protein